MFKALGIREVLNGAKKDLREAGVLEPESSAEFLLREILGMDRAKLYASLDCELSKEQAKKFEFYLARRKKHEPVWQIVGKVDFYGRPFFVTSDVLVPRPETEFLIKQALSFVRSLNQQQATVVDIGTGSGAIIISLAKELTTSDQKQIEYYASDISEKALEVAKRNAKELGVSINFKKGSLFESWKEQPFDLVLANLPYIPEEDLGGLSLDIYHYEPRIALTGGLGGLEIYKEFLATLDAHLNPKGVAICEIGHEQGEILCKIADQHGFYCLIKKDLADVDRIAIIKRK